MHILEGMNPNEWFGMNAKLQAKKNSLRKCLKDRGILPREGNNTFDRYKYFSEAQYKLLFTELFATYGLELKFTELEYATFEGSEKQANGRMPRIEFTLFDVDTGFFEDTVITGEGIDKGDKAGYKAYTGALKYYLASTFMVATGDDPETESPQNTMNSVNRKAASQPAPTGNGKATEKQIAVLLKYYSGDNLERLLQANGIMNIEELPAAKASELIGKLSNRK